MHVVLHCTDKAQLDCNTPMGSATFGIMLLSFRDFKFALIAGPGMCLELPKYVHVSVII